MTPSPVQERQEYSEFLGQMPVPWSGVEGAMLSKQRGWPTVCAPGIFAASQVYDGWCPTFSLLLLAATVIMHISRVEL